MVAVHVSHNQPHRLIVGIDYGTTFSGIAFGDTVNDDARAVGQYPGSSLHDEKTPSQVAYDPRASRGYYIGHQIQYGLPRQRWTKLLLDEKRIMNDEDFDQINLNDGQVMFDSNLHQQLPPDKDACDVVGDYLTIFYEHAMERLELELGPDIVRDTPISWMLTVPAVWSDQAMSLTMRAAIQAGIGQRQNDKIAMISEPEAAAICTIKDLEKRTSVSNAKRFEVGDHFLICDAGGGTVDLITYSVVQTKPQLRITEAVVGSGDKCGSVFVDQEFHKHLHETIGEDRYNSISTKSMTTLMKDFEEIKRAYGSRDTEDEIQYLPLRGFDDNPNCRIENEEFLLEDYDLQRCFDAVVDKIIDLLNNQIQEVKAQSALVKNIILVGGFGQSCYLLKRLQMHNWNEHPKIDIIVPHGAWSAISRGAVLRVIHGSLVVERKSRRSYGTRMNTIFDPMVHSDEDAFISTDTGLKMARNQISWVITKGMNIDSKEKYSIECSTTFQKGEPLIRGTTLVASESDNPPTSYTDQSVYDVCFLQADLRSVPESEFKEHRIGGQTFLLAEFTIELTKDSADLKFELCYEGKTYGQVKTRYC